MNFLAQGPLSYRQQKLHFDAVPLGALAKKFPTPFYLYSEQTLIHQAKLFVAAANNSFSPLAHTLVCYATKANPQKELLSLLAKHNLGADIVSGGELQRSEEAGITAKKIVFSGVGKTASEITLALRKNILFFNVESADELRLINQLAKKMKKKAQVSFRLNPQVHAKTHKYISTGNKTHKFGMLSSDIFELIQDKNLWDATELVGLSIHIGSQLTEFKATQKALKILLNVIEECEHYLGRTLPYIDVGGGLGIDYHPDDYLKVPSIEDYMQIVFKTIAPHLKKSAVKKTVVFEPGRIIIARSGVLVCKVVRTKKSEGFNFLVIDGGMNDLLRPSLYQAYHKILPEVLPSKMTKLVPTDVVGPICETSDCFATERLMPELKNGDLVVIADCGAYGSSMASTYNLRGRPCEVLLSTKGKTKILKAKETYTALR